MFLSFIQNHPFIPAFILGIIPALVWLWFWLKEDRHPEPARMLTLSFLGGMISVLFVLPIQRFVYDAIASSDTLSFAVWATIEEIFKFAFVYAIALRHKALADEPVDDMIYMIVGALGFVALENTLFLIDPLKSGSIMNALVTNNLRFVGASLVHVISSSAIGFALAISFWKTAAKRAWYVAAGLTIAIILHTIFNLFIISQPGENVFYVLAGVWLCIAVLLSLFEKVKSLSISRYL